MRNNQLCRYSRCLAAICLLAVLFCPKIYGQDFSLQKSKYVQDTTKFKQARGFYKSARAALDRNDNQSAIDNYLKSIDSYKLSYETALESGEYETAIEALLEKARIERRIYENNIPYETLDIARDILNKSVPLQSFLWFRTYYEFGLVAHSKNDFYKAIDYLDSAQLLYDKSSEYDLDDYKNLIEYKFYDYIYSNKNIDTVQKYIEVRLNWEYERQKEKPDPEKLIYILEDYPDIYSQKGEYDIALAHAISNYKFFNQNRDQIKDEERYGEVYFDLSLALYRKDLYEKALKIAFEYLNSDNTLLSENKRADMISLVGLIYNELNQPEKSISYFKQFLEFPYTRLDTTLQDKIAKATTLLNMGINLYELGKTEQALDNYNRSLEQMKSLVEYPSAALINCYRYLGDFYVQEDLWHNALYSYDSALRNTELQYDEDLLEFPSSDSSSRFSLESLTIIKKKTKALFRTESQDPVRYLESVINHVDKTHEKIRVNREDLYKSDGKLFLSQFFKDLYETGIEACFQLYQATGSREYAVKAFKYTQLSKSNLFLEQEKDYKEFTSLAIPFDLKEEYYKTSGELENIKGLLYSALDNSVTGDSVLRLSDQIIALETKTASLKDSISENYSNEQEPEVDSLITDDLAPDSYLIEFFYGSNSIFTFGIDSNRKISFKKIANTEDFKASLEGFLNIVSSPPDYENFDEDLKVYRKEALSLYENLIKPVLEDAPLEPDELVIVPDEFLTRIPFEALLTDRGDSKGYKDFDYLIGSYKIRYLISSNVRKHNNPALNKNYQILGIGFSSTSSNLGNNRIASLPGTEREIQFLEASFNGDYYLGRNGTRQQFLDRARNYDIIHLAVHGKADSMNRFQSSLIFNGPDSILNPSQLYLANINAQLIVLSACESGKGQIESGEGTFSIARGFAIVGVPNIVMSLWEVNDRTTSSQMVGFYENFLKSKLDLNSSLRNVKLDYISSGDSYLSHPFYWASFIHVGQNTSFEQGFLKNYGFVLFITLLGAAILISGFIIYKKRKGIQK